MCGVMAWCMCLTILLAVWNPGTLCITGFLWFAVLAVLAGAGGGRVL